MSHSTHHESYLVCLYGFTMFFIYVISHTILFHLKDFWFQASIKDHTKMEDIHTLSLFSYGRSNQQEELKMNSLWLLIFLSLLYFRKIYCLIWKNLLSNIFWENIKFDFKRIYCWIYIEKIYCLISRKFIVEYILRKYTTWFEENLLPNIFWENILFDLNKIYCRIYFENDE